MFLNIIFIKINVSFKNLVLKKKQFMVKLTTWNDKKQTPKQGLFFVAQDVNLVIWVK